MCHIYLCRTVLQCSILGYKTQEEPHSIRKCMPKELVEMSQKLPEAI